MRGAFLVVLYVVFFSLTSATFSATVKNFNVNGYSIFLVDVGFGNESKIIVNVQAGSKHDVGQTHAGRAHLLEHVLFSGSKAYPGHETFRQKIKSFGGLYNGTTSQDNTYYHWTGHEQKLYDVLDLYGAMLTAPEWNKSAFTRERSIVIEEAAQSLNQQGDALYRFAPWLFLPESHPHKMFTMGSRDQLNQASRKDLIELFEARYVPEAMQIIVAGNFSGPTPNSHGRLTESELLLRLEQSFPGKGFKKAINEAQRFDVRTQSSDRYFTPPFAQTLQNAESLKLVFLESKQLHILLHFISDIDPKVVNREAIETIRDYIGLVLKGSLSDILERNGWSSGVDAHSEFAENLMDSYVVLNLTAKGLRELQSVLTTIFEFLGQLKTEGISPDVLEYLVMRNISAYQRSAVSAARMGSILHDLLNTARDPSTAFDFENRYRVSHTDILTAASQMFPSLNQVLITVTKSIANVTDSAFDELFGRKYSFLEIDEERRLYQELREKFHKVQEVETPFAIEIPALPFEVEDLSIEKSHSDVAKVTKRPVVIESDLVDTEIALHSVNAFPTASVKVLLQFPASSTSISDRQKVKLFLNAFYSRYLPEVHSLWARGVQLTMGSAENGLNLSFSGTVSNILKTHRWVLQKLHAFEPTSGEIEFAINQMRGYSFWNGYTANIAADYLARIVGSSAYPSEDDAIKNLSNWNPEELVASFRKVHSRTHLFIAGAGRLAQPELDELARHTRHFFPGTVTFEELRSRSQIGSLNENKVHEKEIKGIAGLDQFGRARAWLGPTVGTEDYAALKILANALDNAVFEENRTRRNLGYIQSVSFDQGIFDSHLVFYGQAEGDKSRLKLIEDGWNIVLEQLRTRVFSEDSLSEYISQALLDMERIPTDPSTYTNRMIAGMKLGLGPNNFERLEMQIRDLNSEKILNAANKYLHKNAPFIETVITRRGSGLAPVKCGAVFNGQP